MFSNGTRVSPRRVKRENWITCLNFQSFKGSCIRDRKFVWNGSKNETFLSWYLCLFRTDPVLKKSVKRSVCRLLSRNSKASGLLAPETARCITGDCASPARDNFSEFPTTMAALTCNGWWWLHWSSSTSFCSFPQLFHQSSPHALPGNTDESAWPSDTFGQTNMRIQNPSHSLRRCLSTKPWISGRLVVVTEMSVFRATRRPKYEPWRWGPAALQESFPVIPGIGSPVAPI
jgi:hypothetical protein